MMNKEMYVRPEIRTVKVEVERGFASSDVQSGLHQGNLPGWEMGNNEENVW